MGDGKSERVRGCKEVKGYAAQQKKKCHIHQATNQQFFSELA